MLVRTLAKLLEQETPKQNGSNKIGMYFFYIFDQWSLVTVLLTFATIHRAKSLLTSLPSGALSSSPWLIEAGLLEAQ